MVESVAIIGSGAAAFGVLKALEHCGREVSIRLFDVATEFEPTVQPDGNPETWTAAEANLLYRQLRRQNGLAFPPPKTYFGTAIPRHDVDGKPRVWKSVFLGGLTNIWGGSMFPYTERELRSWPFGPDDLRGAYDAIADAVGIAGADDNLSGYFGRQFVNRPAPRLFGRMDQLADAINAPTPIPEMNILAGANRIALETRPEHSRGR